MVKFLAQGNNGDLLVGLESTTSTLRVRRATQLTTPPLNQHKMNIEGNTVEILMIISQRIRLRAWYNAFQVNNHIIHGNLISVDYIS